MAPYTLQASLPRRWPPRMAPLEAQRRVVFGVAQIHHQGFTSSQLATQGCSLMGTADGGIWRGPIYISGISPSPLAAQDGPLEESPQRVAFGVGHHPPGPPSPRLAIQHGALGGTAEGGRWYWARPHTPTQASHPRHWRPMTTPSEAPQRVVLGVAPYTLQASHPRHLPPRVGPVEAPQSVVFWLGPTRVPGPPSSSLDAQAGSFRGAAVRWRTRGSIHPPGLSCLALATPGWHP